MSLIELYEYAKSGSGDIATATPYLKEMQACLSGDGACPTKLFNLESSDSWKKMIKDADDRLTYHHEQSEIKNFQAGEWDESIVPKNTRLVYDAVLSTSQKDRDGDIVRTDGMHLEKSMPLLWQHVWAQPIGKMLSVVDQNADQVICKYAIADTDLGRDTATLVEMGALRKSHGFFPKPGRFEPLETVKRADGSLVVKGYDIKECDVYESSLVSIPANAGAKVLRTYEKEFDAVCQAVSQKKLETSLVSGWAKGLYEKRQRFYSGAEFETKLEKHMAETAQAIKELQEAKDGSPASKEAGGDDYKKKDCRECDGGKMDATGVCDSCGHIDGKSAATPWLKKFEAGMEKMAGMPETVSGSFESVQMQINKKAEDYLESKDIDVNDYEYTYLVATFADSCLVCVRNWRKDSERCYSLSWASDDSGMVSLMGDPAEVKIEATVTAKALRDHAAWTKEMTIADHADQFAKKAIAGGDASQETINTLKSAIRILEADQKEVENDPLAALFGV